MSSPRSPTLDEVVEKIMEDLLKERVEQTKNQETVPAKKVREENETEDMEGDVADTRVFFTNKGAENFKKTLEKKGFVEERGFKELVQPFKEEIERCGWEMLSKHMELGRRALVKEFYANLGERKNLTCYVRGGWVPLRRSPNHLDSDKEETAPSLKSSKRTPTLRRSQESSPIVKGIGRE